MRTVILMIPVVSGYSNASLFGSHNPQRPRSKDSRKAQRDATNANGRFPTGMPCLRAH